MTLIVEDGTGLATAESYCSTAEADAYHTARGREAAWSDLDDEVKEQLLRQAADFMRQLYRQRWKGMRASQRQALDWPRYQVELEDVGFGGYHAYVLPTVVPDEVKNACAELALRAKSGELAPDVKRQVAEKTIGPITTVYTTGAPAYTQYRAIDLMLAPYLEPRMQMVRA